MGCTRGSGPEISSGVGETVNVPSCSMPSGLSPSASPEEISSVKSVGEWLQISSPSGLFEGVSSASGVGSASERLSVEFEEMSSTAGSVGVSGAGADSGSGSLTGCAVASGGRTTGLPQSVHFFAPSGKVAPQYIQNISDLLMFVVPQGKSAVFSIAYNIPGNLSNV